MRKIPCTYIRGGTSRALFFKEEDLPEDRSLWPELFIKALGVRRTAAGLSAMGVDFPTHKVAVISPHQGPEADVDYNFFQVDSENYYVDNRGNCGNMSSAVGPFAIDEGMVEAREPETVVRMMNPVRIPRIYSIGKSGFHWNIGAIRREDAVLSGAQEQLIRLLRNRYL